MKSTNHGNPNEVQLRVVVNGEAVTVTANRNSPLKTVIPEALHESQNQGQPPENWELKDADGNLLDPNRKIEDFQFADKATLYLSLRVGIGG
jgi:hypothetical protein